MLVRRTAKTKADDTKVIGCDSFARFPFVLVATVGKKYDCKQKQISVQGSKNARKFQCVLTTHHQPRGSLL